MGNDKRKRTKQTPDSDISDFDENNQPPTTSTNDTPQHFPRLILVESKEENRQITSLSPFVIQKVIQSIAGEPENIKNLLFTEVFKKAHAENLLRAQTFSRFESPSVSSYLAEFLKRGNSLPRIEELRRGGDSRTHKISRSDCSKKIQSKTKQRVKRPKHLCLYI